MTAILMMLCPVSTEMYAEATPGVFTDFVTAAIFGAAFLIVPAWVMVKAWRKTRDK